EKLVLDPLGIVEAIDADANASRLVEAELAANLLAAHARRRLFGIIRSPDDRCRKHADRDLSPLVAHGAAGPVHLGARQLLDRREEVHPIVRGLQTNRRAAEQALEQLAAPRTDRKRLRTRPRD